jgi:hypothetical protein
MSLISVRNLSAPLRSKMQIGGLIIAALLVLVIRLGASGSSDGLSRDEILRDADDEAVRRAQLTELLNDSRSPEERPAPSKRQPAGSDDVLEGLVDGRFDKQLKQKREEDTSGNSFEDIRRSLGIE